MYVSKLISAIFLLFITCLTITYFIINKDAMRDTYGLVLFIFSLINVVLLSALIFAPPRSDMWIRVLLFMVIGAFTKALLIRNVPGKHLDDFIFTLWKFNDDWPYLIKVAWHALLNWLVLFIILGLKNSYRLFR